MHSETAPAAGEAGRKAETRDRILRAAARSFRRTGIGGSGVADVMRAAGLTHGGFYAHFASKDDLVTAACAAATDETRGRLAKLAANAGPDGAFAAIVQAYLSEEHRDRPDGGCTMATLGPEIARGDGAARAVFTRHLTRLFDLVASTLPAGDADRRGQAIAVQATLLGALVMARSTDDPALSREILESCKARLLAG
jgi:TetR/AcrR family transcriptional repressor of nem operon